MSVNSMEGRLKKAKWAYTTRNVQREDAVRLLRGDLTPEAGDLVLARVEETGQHRRLELVTSRRAELFEGDEIVVAYGNRYASDQFEGVVPSGLGPCRLVAAGGIAARLLNRHDRVKQATRIRPQGLLANDKGQRINLRSYGLAPIKPQAKLPLVVAVAGTAMNAGKTTACANLVKGFVRRRLHVAAAKVTGTGAGADYRVLVDAGAEPVYDFVDAGRGSTYLLPPADVRRIFLTLIGHLSQAAPDVVVLEVADGVLQKETAHLFMMPEVAQRLDGVLFAAGDSLGAQAGAAWLSARQLPVIGITGLLTGSPLACREAEIACGLPVYHTNSLRRSNVAALIYHCLQSRRRQEQAMQVAAEAHNG